ncbi:hypothetical protein BGZ54_002374 [Gamsiella multidivaricata]|nr:hypothetical protein BGZ54_002374 [Gamsiella multidivaricata]
MAIFFGECGVYWITINRCIWPENSSWDTSDTSLQERYRLAIIANPQLTDWFSYKQSGPALWLTEFYTDIFMRRSFARFHRAARPDAVMFLGDLNDGGRETLDEERFEKNKNRFLEKVFDSSRTAWNLRPLVMDAEDLESSVQKPRQVEASSNAYPATSDGKEVHGGTDAEETLTGQFYQVLNVPLDASERAAMRSEGRSVRLYVAGNHDVGFGDTLVRRAMKRYKKEFGSVNYEIDVGNHSFIIMDTLSFSSNITFIREESRAFVSRIGREGSILPRMLFTHVPLFRPDTTFCGEARESDQPILSRNGEQFQNMVNASLSRAILGRVQADMVFSGDSHGWCEITHLVYGKLTPEVTVPTFSFAQGIRQPAFLMLSLYNPEQLPKNIVEEEMISTSPTFSYDKCMLPEQLSIYFGYVSLLVLTCAWLLVLRFRWFMQNRPSSPLLGRWRPTSSILEKAGRSSNMPRSWNIRDPFASQGPAPTAKLLPARTLNPMDAFEKSDDAEIDIAGTSSPLQRSLPSLSPRKALSRTKKWAWIRYTTWPLGRLRFWRMLVGDLWMISRYVLPFYLLLLVVSLM